MLSDILSRTPVQSIDEAVAVMEAIDARLPDTDGVKWFNRLYLRVSVGVRAAVASASFHDPAFVTLLDVIFANQYFAALAEGERSIAAAPPAWRPLLEERHSQGIAPIRFAIAGMNAHINRDLPDGIVRCFEALGGDPRRHTGRQRDFEAVNPILERVEQEVKTEFAVGLVGLIDSLGGEADDVLAMWKVRKARAAAWTNANVLWTLRRLPRLRDEFFDRLDSLVGLTGRGLLAPRIPRHPPSP